MKFSVKKPCAQCPFRKDVQPFLRRASTIAQEMRDDTRWFACHQTTGQMHGKRVKPAEQSHCAGLMGVLWNEGRPNIAMRLALIYKLITIKQIKAATRLTFRSFAAFERHHAEGK